MVLDTYPGIVPRSSKRFQGITLNGVAIQCLVDTGADLSIVCHSVFKKMLDVKLEKSYAVLRGLGSFASRVVIVKQMNGTNRICIDFRQLNRMVHRDIFPVTLMDKVLEKLQAT